MAGQIISATGTARGSSRAEAHGRRLSNRRKPGRRTGADDPAAWLREQLATGGRLSTEVIAEAQRSGLSRATIYRNLEAAGVITYSTGQRQPRLWMLSQSN